MKADGNCFYRALSYQLFGTQEDCDIVHSVVYFIVPKCTTNQYMQITSFLGMMKLQ